MHRFGYLPYDSFEDRHIKHETSCVAAHTLEDGHLWSDSTA